jgi:hypothetical protein
VCTFWRSKLVFLERAHIFIVIFFIPVARSRYRCASLCFLVFEIPPIDCTYKFLRRGELAILLHSANEKISFVTRSYFLVGKKRKWMLGTTGREYILPLSIVILLSLLLWSRRFFLTHRHMYNSPNMDPAGSGL